MNSALWAVGFTVVIALEAHRWLPTQNIIAAAGMISLVACLENVLRGALPARVPWVECLTWFSHVLAARGLVRLVLFPGRGRPGYGLGVLIGTTLVASLSLGLTRTAWGQAPALGAITLQTAALGIAVLAASAWLLVKKPVPETPNPRPAGFWMALTCTQVWILFQDGHLSVATLAAVAAVAAFVGVGVSSIASGRLRPSGQ